MQASSTFPVSQAHIASEHDKHKSRKAYEGPTGLCVARGAIHGDRTTVGGQPISTPCMSVSNFQSAPLRNLGPLHSCPPKQHSRQTSSHSLCTCFFFYFVHFYVYMLVLSSPLVSLSPLHCERGRKESLIDLSFPYRSSALLLLHCCCCCCCR